MQDVEHLIRSMKEELDDMRYMVYRYNLMHGSGVYNGVQKLPDTVYFRFNVDDNKDCTVTMHDTKNITPMKSRYEKILSEIEKLTIS